MDIKKLNPWNWFKHEEGRDEKNTIPVRRGQGTPSLYHPLGNVAQLHREIDRLFDDAFRGFPSISHSPFWGNMVNDELMSSFRASVNISSDDKQYTITLEAPGMEQKDLSIELKDHALFIKGEKQQEQEEKDQHFYRIERLYGAFERVLAIPEDGGADDISASMKNGVLTVTIPRREPPKSNVKQIEIKR